MSEEIWDVKRLLEWTAGYFKKHGSPSPRLEAEVLLAQALGFSRMELYTHYDTVPAEEERVVFRGMVKRHGNGEPVAYLVGHKEFYSLDFTVTPDTLIPRPETEQLVLEGIEFLRRKIQSGESPNPAVLDIGTGSGCIAAAIAKNVPQAAVTAADISEAALTVAQKNAEAHHLTDRIEFRCSDLFANIEDIPPLDLLVSNPPYITAAEYSALEPTVRDFEPKGALLAGVKGTEIIERILTEGKSRLKSGALVLIEISPMIAGAVRRLAEEAGYFGKIEILPDFAGLDRLLSAIVE